MTTDPLDGSGSRGDRLAVAFQILELVAEQRTGISANDLARVLGLHRATVYRAVNWLVQQEFLHRRPDLTGFILGVRVVEFAKLISVVQTPQSRLMGELRRSIGEAIHLARYEGTGITLVDPDQDHPVSDPEALIHAPARSAIGQLLLAESGGAASCPGLSRTDLAEIVEATTIRGYAQQIGQLTPDRACIAVPVRLTDGTLRGAVALAAEPRRISVAARHVERLRAASVELATIWSV